MRWLSSILIIAVLIFWGCKKDNSERLQMLTGGGYKDWQRTASQLDSSAPVPLDSCFTDDVWRFWESGALQVDIKGTNCAWFISPGVFDCHWYFNPAEDSITWITTDSLHTFSFKLHSLTKDQMIVSTMTDTGQLFSFFKAR